MGAVLLALASALSYGMSDFVGGILSKTRSVWMVAVASQATAAVATAVIALATPGEPRPADFAWGAAVGVGGAVGITFLYRGLSRGRMGVVAPVSGVGAALVPVAVGLASGEEPSVLAWVGIVVAFPAIYLVAQADEKPTSDLSDLSSSGFRDGVIAGLGFGALFAFVGQIGGDAGIMPLALGQLVVAAVVASVAIALRQPWIPRGDLRGLSPVFAFGLLGTAAQAFFLLATREGLLTTVSVIAALYPAGTVAMAAIILREKIGRLQSVGLALAIIAVVLVTVG